MFGLMRSNQDFMNPWREMELFEKAFFGAPALPQFRTDVTDEGDHFLLEADLPGMEKKDITLEIQEDNLIIRAERKSKAEHTDNKIVRRERSYGSYCRRFGIAGVDAEKISAKYTDGVLQVTLPKLEKKQARRLEIN